MAAGKSAPETTAPDGDLMDQVDKMFGEQGAGGTDEMFVDADDLLDQVEEDDSEGWNPTEKGAGIAGVIIKIGETRSDFAKPGDNPMVPTVTIQNREGKFRIIGFGSVLKREMEDLIETGAIKVGNLLAAKYWGEKPIKRGPYAGKNYKHYSVMAQPPAPRQP